MPEILGTADAAFGTVVDAFAAAFSDEQTGAALAVVQHGRPVIDVWTGTADPRDGRPWTHDTPSVIFSCSKGLASLVVGRLIDAGRLALEQPLADIWPEFAAGGKGAVTVGDALAHRGGVSAPRVPLDLDAVLDGHSLADGLAAQEPLWELGSGYSYHTISHGALTEQIVLRVTGEPLSVVFRREIAEPLGAAAWFGLPSAGSPQQARLVTTPAFLAPMPDGPADARFWIERASTLGTALPGSLVLGDAGFNDERVLAAGLAGAGGIATASGLAHIWGAAVASEHPLVSAETIAAMTAVRSSGHPVFDLGGPYNAWGAGFMVPSGSRAYLSPRSFGHDGAGGQFGFADPDSGIGFALLTNRLEGPDRGDRVIDALNGVLAAR